MHKSFKLYTFNTPYGRYKFIRLTYGISSATEVFSKKFKDIFQDIDGCEPYVDDLIVWGKDKAEHDSRLNLVLKRAREQNIKFNLAKFKFAQSSVKYMGHILTNEGLKVDDDKKVLMLTSRNLHVKKVVNVFLV